MATVTKDFKVKSGLVVEGANATVNNYDILTKKQDDQDYIVNLIGGTATSQNDANTVVKRDAFGNFVAGQIDLESKLTTPQIQVGNAGDVEVVDGNLIVQAYDGNDLVLHGDSDVIIKTNNSNVDLRPDGIATIWGNQIATQNDAQSYSSDAYNNAVNASNNYTDDRIGNIQDVNVAAYIENTASSTLNSAESYTDTSISNLNLSGTYDALGAADNAENAANSYTDQEIGNLRTQAQGYATTAENNAKAYTDAEVAALVDSAPALLDTLNELAAAISDNPNYATDVANLVATKADTSYVNAEISSVDTNAQGYATNAENSAKSYADSLATNYDSAGSANSAEQSAKSYADTVSGQAENSANQYTDSAIGTVNGTIDNLTTDDIPENLAPVNQYFTDARAKFSAADLILNASKTNIQISGDSINGLVITAENGVADSTTSDLAEGSNLYFTDARAVSAIEAVVPNFTEIDVNNLITKVATQSEVSVASQVTAHEFDSAIYRSAEYTVKVAYGSHTELSKVMLTLDSSDNIAITEFAVVGTNGSASTVTADVNGGMVRLRVTTANNNSVVTVFGTIIK